MGERNETWADIAAELRAEAAREMEDPGGWYEQPTEVVANRLNGLADRIEAAGEREAIRRDKTSFHCGDCAKFGFGCDAGDVDGNEDCLACESFVRGDHLRDATKMVGNAAALREALAALVDYWNWGGYDAGRILRLQDEARAALSAPPRNCDMFTAEKEARHEWWEQEVLPRVRDEKEGPEPEYTEWLFAPAAMEGGGHGQE